MDNYIRAKGARSEDKAADNEVRITAAGKSRAYITFSTSLLTEKNMDTIVIKAIGKAINKAVAIAEIVKRRITGLHQLNAIGSAEITDVWEPKEEGLDNIETVRRVSTLSITLSKAATDADSAGYQAPLPEDEVKPLQNEGELLGEDDGDGEGRRRNRRGRGSGNRGGGGGGRGRNGGGHAARTGDPVEDAAAGTTTGKEGGEKRSGRVRRRGRGRGRGPRGDGDGAAAAEGNGGKAAGAAAAPAKEE